MKGLALALTLALLPACRAAPAPPRWEPVQSRHEANWDAAGPRRRDYQHGDGRITFIYTRGDGSVMARMRGRHDETFVTRVDPNGSNVVSIEGQGYVRVNSAGFQYTGEGFQPAGAFRDQGR